MILTKEHLLAARSDLNGYSDKQFALIGIARPIPKGWRKKVVGKEYPDEVVAEFVALKNAHLTPARRKNFKTMMDKRNAKREAEGRSLVVPAKDLL